MNPVPLVTARATRKARSALSLPVQVKTTFDIASGIVESRRSA